MMKHFIKENSSFYLYALKVCFPVLLISLSFLNIPSYSQGHKQFKEIKSFTDSTGTVHLFFRILAERKQREGQGRTSHVYHYDSSINEYELFLFSSFDQKKSDNDPHQYVTDFRFFNNDPEKFIYSGTNNVDKTLFIKRQDGVTFEYTTGRGGALWPNILTTGSDTSTVFALLINQWVKSNDAGKTWPDSEDILNNRVPDSLVMEDFMLLSISPFDGNLLFGKLKGLLARSINGGNTFETYEHKELSARTRISYDANRHHLYAIQLIYHAEACQRDRCFALFSNSKKGESGFWVRKQVFDYFPGFVAHPQNTGVIYIWSANSIYLSNDYGESFSFFYKYEIDEIQEVTVEGDQLFFITNKSLYQIRNGMVTELINLQDI